MYDAKKTGNLRCKQLQYDCISDRNYFYMCKHNNMVNIKISSAPVETILTQFK